METYTLVELATMFKVPESTLRYHCKKYIDYLPTTGKGNARRYQEGAIPVIAKVLDCVERKMPQHEIESELDQEFPRFIEVEQESCETPAIVQQPPQNEVQTLLMGYVLKVAEVEQRNTEQGYAIHNLHEEVTELRQRDSEKDKVILRMQQQIEELSKPWWKRFF